MELRKTLLPDNGKEFTDRFNLSDKKPSGNYSFDKVCKKYNIEHRLTKPRHPQTNGMVERFNDRIKQVIITTRFKNAEELRETLMTYLYTYNHLLPQRVLNGKTPIETLSEYYKSHLQIFKTNPANLTEPDR